MNPSSEPVRPAPSGPAEVATADAASAASADTAVDRGPEARVGGE